MMIEKRNFLKGLNSDDSQRLLGDGECLNIMNARMSVSEFGRNFRLENIPSTKQIVQAVFPPYGTQQCLGSCIDEARNRIIFFIINTHGDNGIYAYDLNTNIMYAVLYDSQVTGGLGFSKTSRIDRNAKVVGDLLYWTDNLNQPRRINIEAGIKTNKASYVTTVAPYSYPMTQSVISLIRRPYGLAVTSTRVTDGTFSENFVSIFAGQAATRLVYRDGEYSVVGVPCTMINYDSIVNTTFNAIDFVFPLSETFDQDVQEVQVLIRFDNNPNYFIFKEWNKNVASEAAEIAAHNSGSAALTYRFYNNSKGIAVSTEDSVKPEDSIGITAKTLEFADNRLFLANYVKGYDTPDQTSLGVDTINTHNDSTLNTLIAAFPPNSSYQIAIRFRDNSGRKSFIVTNAGCVLNVPDRTLDPTAFVTSLTWLLSNAFNTRDIPDWAYYYDIMITKNLSYRFFVEGSTTNIQYAIKNANGTFSYQSTYSAAAYGIGIDSTFLTGILGLGYTFNQGDLMRLYLSTTATVFELEVLGQDGNYILVKLANIGSLSTIPRCLFHLFTPYQKAANETFYTTGQSYVINNPTTGSRSYSTTTGTILGDTFWYRVSLFDFRLWVMSSNTNFWKNWFGFYGESSISFPLGQVNKTNFIQWSNVKIIGAQTNGLSTFDANDEKPIPVELGEINKLQLTNKISDLGQGNIMLAICPTETASCYLGETQLMADAKQGDVATSTLVIGTINVLTGSRGTINPETVIPVYGLVFFYDTLQGRLVQYSPNGLEDVSNYKMARYFKNYAKDYLAASTNNLDNINGFHHIPTGVDTFHKELLVTTPALIYENYADTLPSYSSVPVYATSVLNRFDIYDSLGKTMAFSWEENKWGSDYEFLPEWFENIQDRLFAWKNGVMYEHNVGTNQNPPPVDTAFNYFYGVSYPVRICVTGNLNPSLIKDLFNIGVEATDIPNYVVALTAVPYQQITDLASTDSNWVNQQGVFYATFLRDRLSPNSVGTADAKLFTGDILVDFSIFVMAEFDVHDHLFYCQFLNIGYEMAKGQQNIVNVINK